MTKVGEYQVEAVSVVCDKRFGHHNGLEILVTNAMQQHIHDSAAIFTKID